MNLLVIIPCYNEEFRLDIKAFEKTFSLPEAKGLQFLFVNDGSSDNTLEILTELGNKFEDHVKVLDLKQNAGKAEAIRQGMLLSSELGHEYLGYFDADLATPLEEIPRLFRYTQKTPPPYMVMGSRIKLLGSTDIQRKLSRHYVGRVFATIVSNMLQLPIYDTQCGAKLIHKDAVLTLFKEPFSSKWLFDVELLFRLKKSYADFEGRIVEVPLKKWEDVAGSKIGLLDFLKAPLDLLRIYFHYR